MAKQKFKLVYVKDGALCGSYSGIPGKKDIVLITRAALEGLESPIPEGYIVPEGVLEITENGEVDIAEFKKVIVNIPAELPTGSIEITSNGEHDVAGKATAVVNVPNPSTGILNIEANGEYNVTEKAGVNVAVPQPSGTLEPDYYEFNREYETTFNVTDYESIRIPSVSSMCSDTYYINSSSGSGYGDYNVAGYSYAHVDWPTANDLCEGTQYITLYDGVDISDTDVVGYRYVEFDDSDIEIDDSITITMNGNSYRLTRLS